MPPVASRSVRIGPTRWHRIAKHLRRSLAALVALLVGVGFQVGTATTAEASEPSLGGCPLLLENKSTGPCVVALQQELNAVNPAYGLSVDGNFGSATRIAVLDFQGRNNLPADGNVGAETASALQEQFDALTPTADNSSPSAAAVTCTPDATSGPPSASIPPDLQPYFRCTSGANGSPATTATEVTCTPDTASGPPSASIPPDLQHNFQCFPTAGGSDLSAECAIELLSATTGLPEKGLSLTGIGKLIFKKVPVLGWVLTGTDVALAARACSE
jgi:peptidoglycan hydrolase-like protein with peptidoglycan-binding domain